MTLLASRTSFDYQLCTPTQNWAGTPVSPGQPPPKDDVNVFGSERRTNLIQVCGFGDVVGLSCT